jgi:hypothetical protein
MGVEVAILMDDLVEIVEDVDVKIGFATLLAGRGAPLLLGWLFLIVIRGRVGRRKVEDTGKLGPMRRSES